MRMVFVLLAAQSVWRQDLPSDHRFGSEGRILAVDLEHGNGSAQMRVCRTSAGQETWNTHFGPGWSDGNLVCLTLIDSDSLLIWRGGLGWRSAHREGERFVVSGGGEIFKTKEGWSYLTSQGELWIFDERGRLTIESPSRVYSYDEQGRLLSIREGPKNVLRYRYSENRVTSVEGPEGLVAQYTYDQGRLAAATNARKVRTEYRYDAHGALASARDSFGNEVDGSKRKPAEEPLREISESEKVQCAVDRLGRVESVSSPEGKITYGYDAYGRVAGITYPDRRERKVQYNPLDLPVRVDYEDGRWETWAYDDHGRLIRRETSDQRWEAYRYDRSGRLEQEGNASSFEKRYAYDDQGRVKEIAFSDGRKVSFTYDKSGNPSSESWSSGERRSWKYDANGRVVEATDGAGLTITYTYGSDGVLTRVDDPIHGTKKFQATSAGYAIEQEGLGRWEFQVEGGRPVTVTKPSGRVTRFEYGPGGKPIEVIPPSGLLWRYAYDLADRLTGIEGPGGTRTVLAYDPGGRVTSVNRAGVAWRQYRYDALGRLDRESSPQGAAAEYGYDSKTGRVSQVRLPEGAVRYSYGEEGGVRKIEGPDYQVEQEWYADEELKRRIYRPADLDLKWPRDKEGRSGGIELNGVLVGYEYEKASVHRLVLPGGGEVRIQRDDASRPTELGLGRVKMKIEYDRADRITKIESEPFTETYEYDSSGNVVGLGKQRLRYDEEDRLVQAGEQVFEYDLQGNSIEGAKCAWDSAGNLAGVERREAKTENGFDAAGRLRQRQKGGATWKYGYLPEGDRSWEEGAGGKRWYAYLPEGLIGFKDSAGMAWLVVYLPDTDWPVALCGSNGLTYYLLADRLRSIRRYVDATGKVVAKSDYGAYGKLEAAEGSAPLRMFAGMVVDESGLMYARQRYYDPELKRFLSIDPELGDQDEPASHYPYAYARNNPYRYRDPEGTAAQDEWIWLQKFRNRPGMNDYLKGLLNEAERELRNGNLKRAKDLLQAVDTNAATPPRIPKRPSVLPKSVPGGGGLVRPLVKGGVKVIGKAALALVGTAVDLYEIGQAAIEFHQMNQAESEAVQNSEQNAKWEGEVLQDWLKNQLQNHSVTLPNGQAADPNNPAHLQELLQMISQNTTSGKNPLAGIFSESLSADDKKKFEEAIQYAKEKIQAGRAIERQIAEAEKEVLAEEKKAEGEVEKGARALVGLSPEKLSREIDEMEKSTQEWSDVSKLKLEEKLGDLSRSCAAAEQTACGLANRSNPPASPEEKKRAGESVQAAEKKLEQAKEAIADLRTKRKVLGLGLASVKRVLANLEAAKGAAKPARQSLEKAMKKREEIARGLSELKKIRGEVELRLGGFEKQPAAARLLGEVRGWGEAIGAMKQTLGQYVGALQEEVAGYEKRGLDRRLRELAPKMDKARETLEELMIPAAFAMKGALEALQRARECYGRLTTGEEQKPTDKPNPSPGKFRWDFQVQGVGELTFVADQGEIALTVNTRLAWMSVFGLCKPLDEEARKQPYPVPLVVRVTRMGESVSRYDMGIRRGPGHRDIGSNYPLKPGAQTFLIEGLDGRNRVVASCKITLNNEWSPSKNNLETIESYKKEVERWKADDTAQSRKACLQNSVSLVNFYRLAAFHEEAWTLLRTVTSEFTEKEMDSFNLEFLEDARLWVALERGDLETTAEVLKKRASKNGSQYANLAKLHLTLEHNIPVAWDYWKKYQEACRQEGNTRPDWPFPWKVPKE